MTRPPPQTKETIEKDIEDARTARLVEIAVHLVGQLMVDYEDRQSDGAFVLMEALGIMIGNTVDPAKLNDMLGDVFTEIRRISIQTIKAKQVGEAVLKQGTNNDNASTGSGPLG